MRNAIKGKSRNLNSTKGKFFIKGECYKGGIRSERYSIFANVEIARHERFLILTTAKNATYEQCLIPGHVKNARYERV